MNEQTIIGELFHEERQPHGSLFVRIEKCERWTKEYVEKLEAEYMALNWDARHSRKRWDHLVEGGYYMLAGTVERGVTVNRLFNHTATRDEAGTAWGCDHVSPRELEKLHKISVAM